MTSPALTESDLERLADMVAARLRPAIAPVATPLLTKAELADHLKVEKAQIDRWVRRGMPREVIGSSPRFDLAACRAWLSSTARPRAGAPSSSPATPGVTPIGRARKLAV